MAGETLDAIKLTISEFPSLVNEWEGQRLAQNQKLKQIGYSSNIINDKFYLSQEQDMLLKDLHARSIPFSNALLVRQYFPSLRLIAYSHFSRVHLTSQKIRPSDIMDIEISGIIPYTDAVIIENFQANVLRKARSFIPQLKDLEIYTLKDIRKT